MAEVFVPIEEALDITPKYLGSNVWQIDFGNIKREEYFQGDYVDALEKATLDLALKTNDHGFREVGLVDGLTGQETRVTRIFGGQEFMPSTDPLTWSGYKLPLENPDCVPLAKICNLTEKGPLPKLKMYPSIDLDIAQPHKVI